MRKKFWILMMAVGLIPLLFAGKEAKGQGRIVPDKPADYHNWHLCTHTRTFGASYNYNECCKVGGSCWWTNGYFFMIEGSIGGNCDKEKFNYQSKAEKKFWKDTKLSTINPLCDICVTPSFHTQFFSLGLGVGFLCSADEHYVYRGYHVFGGDTTYNLECVPYIKFQLLIRPTAKIHIPLTWDCEERKHNYLILGVGYNYIFGPARKRNGMQFSIGFERELRYK